MRPPAIARSRIDLRLHHSVRLQFRHEVLLHSLFSEALGRGELPVSIVPFACESGRTDFERGDLYRIGLTLAGGDPATEMARIARALTIYGSRGNQGERIPMLRSFAVENVEELPPPDVEADTARWRNARELVLQFVSPLRMEIPLEDGGPRRRAPQFFGPGAFPPREFLRLLWSRFFTIENERPPRRAESEAGAPPVPDLHCDPSALLWIDVPRTAKAPLGGVCGALRIGNPGEGWLALLVAGQYLHIGKSIGYGFGAYRITMGQPLATDLWNDPFSPSESVLARIASRERLLGAAQHVAATTEGSGTDGMTPEQLMHNASALASSLESSLRDGTYTAAPLLGIVVPKKDGNLRALAVPTLIDRTVQRAALEILGPAIETLLEGCSFGYRRGFSRMAAAREIERAYADGYRYVLDADIDAFFDSVDWTRLFARWKALYPFDPCGALLQAWVSAPVVYEGKRIERVRGLPQGAVVSPLLANLFLDQFDEDLLHDGFRLVRYADDFVVLCKDLESAERARSRAREALAALGLELKEEKTSVVPMDQGFTYLGYLFCRSVTVAHERETREPSSEKPAVAAASWLAGVDLSRVRTLDPNAPPPRKAEIVPLHGDVAAPRDGRRPLYVSDPGVALHLRDETIVVEREDGASRRIPLRTLSQVIFIGRPRATLPLVLELGLAGIPVFFCRRNGELEAVHGPFEPDVPTLLAQAKAAEDERVRLAFAQEIVSAKLHNYATMAVRHRLRGRDAVSASIREMERSVWNKTDIDSVRGLEGAAGAAWWGAVRETLAPEWRFQGRVKHPPGDPFNAMLSFGYTLLHHHCSAALWAAGLVPRIGLYHRQHGQWAALASDLQEELRYLVDGLVWALVKRREVRPDEFEEHGGGCWLRGDARRRFVEAFEDRMETRFRPEGREEPLTYREAITVQAAGIREYVMGRARYEALRAHA